MIDARAVVWLVEGAESAPSDEARRALEAWARAHGVTLEAPVEGDAPAVPIDWAAADLVEHGIARARDALAALDFEVAERELARAEAALRAHPELPQAAWLRAEVERAWSVRWLREDSASSTHDNEVRAKATWQRAAGLDGGREPGLGEKAFDGAKPIGASIRLTGAGGLRLDGVTIAPGDVTRTEGEHALAIVRADGATTWAEWVSFAQGVVVKLRAPESPACSRDAMAPARLEGTTVHAAGVRCAKWIAAVPEGARGIRIAACEGDSCGALVEWRAIAIDAGPRGPLAPVESRSRWPAWATWTIVGVGVAGAAVGVAAAAGAFRSTTAPETQFVNGGLKVSSF
jgi:hypothetical protein